MQKLKRHGNGGSCLKKHEKLKIESPAGCMKPVHQALA
jgi:hypothetical protein